MLKTFLFGAAFVVLLAGCGGGAASIEPGPMPEGGNFTGVYHSPQYGEMNIVQNGNSVMGEYEKDERKGKIRGSVQGNLMRFEWVEHRSLVSNRPTETRGRGYFHYVVDKENEEHLLKGEWGLDDEEQGGGPWTAWKSKHSKPRLSTDSASSGGGEYEDEGEAYDDEVEEEESGAEEALEPEEEAEDDLF